MIHPSVIFNTPEEQGAYVRNWVKERCGFEPTGMKLDFYPGRYATDKYSIIPVGDVSDYITDDKHDVAVLEEPEHLNWYHHGERWSDKFKHVVGVVHTNYLEYARTEENGRAKEAVLKVINSWVSRVHCHKIIKLSDAVQDFPRSETMNVHGVSPVFLDVGEKKAAAAAAAAEAAAEAAAKKKKDAAAASAVGRAVNRVLASLTARHVTAGAAAASAEANSNASAALKTKQRGRGGGPGGGYFGSGSKRGKRGHGGSEGDAGTTDGNDDSAEASAAAAASRDGNAGGGEGEIFSKGCYFLGKVVWGKGFHELLQRVEEHNSSAEGSSCPLEMDVYGSGEDLESVTRRARDKNLPLQFRGRVDHASDQMHDYKVFINPSLSDVVATTTAEALAMGKFAIVAEHPSNVFFSTFPNCMTYSTPEEFTQCVKRALSTDPRPLSRRDHYRLSWEAATDRFLDAAELGEEQRNGPGTGRGDRMAEVMAHALHKGLASVEPVRVAAGAGPGTLRPPDKLDATWNPQPWGEWKKR